MSQPRWQRARIISSICSEEDFLIGTVIWIRTVAPSAVECVGALNNLDAPLTQLSCEMNVTTSDGRAIRADAGTIERLARDEHDFADDVQLLPWEQFLEECKARP